jgi:hypothetical protein
MKLVFAILACLACAGTLTAETAALTLTNGEANWLYYSVDPVLTWAPSSRTATSDLLTALDRIRFSSLPPGGSLRIDGLADGVHSVIGFWVTDKTAAFGVFRLDLSLAAGQKREYTLKKSAEVAARETPENGIVKVTDTLASTPVVIDGDFSDWALYPAMAAFPPTAAPAQFTVQDKDGARNLPIRNSNDWERAGTKLLTVKALWRTEALYFNALASSPFDPGLSIFLYLFDDRKSTELNQYTIEIPVTDTSGGGSVLLWQRGVQDPVVVGVLRTVGSSLEASIDFSKLPETLRASLFDRYSFDLKTNYFDAARGLHEEFFFTTIDCSEIYRPK